MLFFVVFFFSVATLIKGFVYNVLLIGSRPAERDWDWFFFEETLVFFGLLSYALFAKKYSSTWGSSIFVFRLLFEIPFYFSILFFEFKGVTFIFIGLEICFKEWRGDLNGKDSFDFGDLIKIDYFGRGVFEWGDFETEGLGFFLLFDTDSFLVLLFPFWVLDLLFFPFGSINENLFYLSDSLLLLVIRIIVRPGFEIWEG